ncbi:MAG: SMI1/KNR4 family protein [Micromonosporaceae bacterium]
MTELGIPPASGYAGQVVQFAAPLLRIRYPEAVYVNLQGFPDWIPYARAQVEVAAPHPEAPVGEIRIVHVLAANQVLADSGDPLWQPSSGGPVVATPDGWIWAHLGNTRRLVLVPSEAHTAFRHAGGVATLGADHSSTVQLESAPGGAGSFTSAGSVPESALTELEAKVGAALPAAYREFVASTNGGRPPAPLVHPEFGFVADQSFLGVGRRDWFENLEYARQWSRDRFTTDFLPIGHVQGGTLAVRLTDPGAGSVWYYDDDDPRDDDSYDASVVSSRLLWRCADDFTTLLKTLMPVPDRLHQAATTMAGGGQARLVRHPELGRALPADRRSPQGGI